jgi:penicillin-binding protein 1A
VICDDCKPRLAEAEPEPVAERTEPQLKPLDISATNSTLAVTAVGKRDLSRAPESRGHLRRAVISPQNAYLIRSMMMDVVRRGTGARAMELGRNDLAGKTGTTNEQRDAWFSGYNDHLVTSVWVGFDNHDPLGRRELGGRAALPVWMEFMAAALEGLEDRPPVMPEGLARAKIDPDTGLLARLDDEHGIMEIFEAGRLPPMPDSGQGDNQDAALEEDPYEIF